MGIADKTLMGALALSAVMALTACGNGDSAVETRDRSADAAQAVLTSAPADDGPVATTETEAKPALTANRRETVDAKTARLFQRNGADFDATTPDAYLAKVEQFTRNPPSGTERVERPNGDVLLYQASTNTFAVVSRDGVPKTMFKPRDGASYWAEQKAAAPTFGQRRGSNSSE
ncbi:S-type pyocin family protein [uncultured Brevundimonas sp.]|uniref:S-type pyocin family protein n=1 Tax=uncultured Brevundimonas sp. TaxID=213418 RepID=UPI0025CFB87D|nr:S-type pyocin family protein [uncultured Brevundimonas sp.]